MNSAKYRYTVFYITITGACLGLIYWIISLGKNLEKTRVPVVAAARSPKPANSQVQDTFWHHINSPLSILLLQVIVILVATRLFAYLFKKIKQPPVIGEVVAGIILGPSLAGYWFPSYTAFLFPASSMNTLQIFSQVGLILFMFVIGMELDLKVIRQKARAAVMISHASIIIPYALGVTLALFLYQEYAPANIGFLSFGLFLGISMSITAFPVMARILREKNMTTSTIGGIAIACAAADDITAWFLLAGVISIAKGTSLAGTLITILLALIYITLMLTVVKRSLQAITRRYLHSDHLSMEVIAIMFAVLLCSSYVTEVIGIHALFGAFMAGTIMPATGNLRKNITAKIEHVSLSLLLPLFFALSGLRTHIGALDNIHAWLICAIVISVAILGKFGGSMLTARFVGLSWRDSILLGSLINTRGLMELIVLNIGYDLGILNAEIFTIMVLMALVTTFMTGPIIEYLKLPQVPQTIHGNSQFIPDTELAETPGRSTSMK